MNTDVPRSSSADRDSPSGHSTDSDALTPPDDAVAAARDLLAFLLDECDGAGLVVTDADLLAAAVAGRYGVGVADLLPPGDCAVA